MSKSHALVLMVLIALAAAVFTYAFGLYGIALGGCVGICAAIGNRWGHPARWISRGNYTIAPLDQPEVNQPFAETIPHKGVGKWIWKVAVIAFCLGLIVLSFALDKSHLQG